MRDTEDTGIQMNDMDETGTNHEETLEKRYSRRIRDAMITAAFKVNESDTAATNEVYVAQPRPKLINPFIIPAPIQKDEAEFNEEQGITQEEDTIKAITDREDVEVSTEEQLDIEKHLLPTSGLFVEEIVNPPKDDSLTPEAKQLFTKAGKAKLYSYRFSKQADINPLLRIIDQRHMSKYRVGFTQQRIIEETKQDDRLGPIYNYLLSGKVPHRAADMERVLASVDSYFLYDNVLFHYELINDGDDMTYKLCIPKSFSSVYIRHLP